MNGYSRISGDDDSSSRRSMDHEGERFGVILGRSASVSSSSQFQRAFSMTRSSSVSERYRRIHDQEDTPITTSPSIASKKKQRGGANKILKACKRLLRL
ncbi:hypothetical protein GLYMA_16G002700v4 [Glycine max]|uniref:Uncharacterized protein n=2 Tax=Glycine subgen. Soja TaxID=1462606 RepID=I1MJU9_SOYBN|nr:hypothetical protein JHK86_043990 [Glycine max]KHN39673.1 hypothetical protein glysoja_020751 [Glycine soja]KAG4950709.1 hypothetical protein JHK85_044576 [Glycine max]KAH1204361.1 hypothetical protein GmHk_16G045342 [Glycine max]KRH06061.1 hypothetical protein GLYMA_16G002700v4 [Glycine max]